MADLSRSPEKQTMGGTAPATAVRAMEIAIRKWQAIKYGFLCMDEDGGTIFQIHPNDWEEGDLDYSLRWHEWYSKPATERYMHDFKPFVEEGRERRVDTIVLNALFPQKREVPWYMKGAALIGGAFFVKWLIEPPKPISVPGLATIDTKPIEDIFQELAGQQAKPAIKYDMTPITIPTGDETPEAKGKNDK